MKFNKIHNRYDLPLGLYFSLHYNKVEYPNKWISISNVPALNYFVFERIETKKEILEIIKYLFIYSGNHYKEEIETGITNDYYEILLNHPELSEQQISLFNKLNNRYRN